MTSLSIVLGAIALILLLLKVRIRRKNVHLELAIFIGTLMIAFLTLSPKVVPSLMLAAIWNEDTLRLIVVIASTLTLSSLMERKGLLAEMTASMENIDPKFALHFFPAFIGLVPMPSGALVSMTASRETAKRLGLAPEEGTFIDYWFRHIWEFSVPMYSVIIITSGVLSVSIMTVVKALLPMTILAIGGGSVVSYLILRNRPGKNTSLKLTGNMVYNILNIIWPLVLIIILLLLDMEPMIAFPLTLALLAVQQRVSWTELTKAFNYGLNLRALSLIYVIMLYKTTIVSSGVATTLISDLQAMGLPILLMLVVMPFIVSVLMGLGLAFPAIALPLLAPYITTGYTIDAPALLLAYSSGMLGHLISPLHLCLALSVEYFKASLARVYRYILPLFVVLQGIVIALYYISTR